MNIRDGKGTVHLLNSTGKHSVCRTLVRDHWQPTKQPISCPVCLNGRGPRRKQPELVVEPEMSAMLEQIGCHIVDELLIIQVLPDVSDAIVTVRKSELRAWCKKRIESRKAHKNKALAYIGGAPGERPIRATKV